LEAIIMAKTKSGAANNQRSNTKNPNNKAYTTDRANRIAQGHPSPPPPPPAKEVTTQGK